MLLVSMLLVGWGVAAVLIARVLGWWEGVPTPPVLIGIVALATAFGALALSRRVTQDRWKLAASSLIWTGTAAVIGLLTLPLWDFLLVPPRSEWRDSLPGFSQIIGALGFLLVVATSGLGLGCGLWGLLYLRGRRRSA
ncbi:hypothetical protein OF829_16855 [Sphingomonas sp. LB-2]|uniref:hypothetical protein n=1 Tax=Sphingomonas caeni TaxID=2984949 RepID=UPI002230CF49|nr:hypothetical protein [Sphingomonas caeni]MCW3848909.1 hypothetical protein [Sphingomonas caeni]